MNTSRLRAIRLGCLLLLVAVWATPVGLSLAGAGTAVAENDGGAAVTPAEPDRGEDATSRRAARAAATTLERPTAKWTHDFEEAQRIAKREDKPILANFTGSDWCGWCMRLAREVFKTSTFARWATDNVVLLEVDFPRRSQSAALKKKNRKLQARYRVRGFPTVLFLDADGRVLGRSGYRSGGASAWVSDAETQLRSTTRRP